MSYYPYPTQVMVSPPRRTSTAHLVIAWIVALLSLLYMLPWAVAASRNKSNTGAIALINLFLGWSLIGWVVALVMACSAESNQPQVVVMNGHGMPAYPVQGYAPTYGQPVYPQAQVPAVYPQTPLPAAYPQAAVAPAPAPYVPAALLAQEAASPATAPYPASPATAPYAASPATAPYPEVWSRPAEPVSPTDRVNTETVPLYLADPYAGGASEITRPLPALSDPSHEGHGRQ